VASDIASIAIAALAFHKADWKSALRQALGSVTVLIIDTHFLIGVFLRSGGQVGRFINTFCSSPGQN
jgi:hypothetical protein